MQQLSTVFDHQLEFVRKRYHKDVLNNPVVMLNFCPDLLSEPPDLQQASRELLFLINCSINMTQHSINKIKVQNKALSFMEDWFTVLHEFLNLAVVNVF